MNKATATKVLEEVKNVFSAFIESGSPMPNLRDSDHEELPEGSWSIDWEEGPEDWCYGFRSEVPGVFVEPIYSFVLGVYDD